MLTLTILAAIILYILIILFFDKYLFKDSKFSTYNRNYAQREYTRDKNIIEDSSKMTSKPSKKNSKPKFSPLDTLDPDLLLFSDEYEQEKSKEKYKKSIGYREWV